MLCIFEEEEDVDLRIRLVKRADED